MSEDEAFEGGSHQGSHQHDTKSHILERPRLHSHERYADREHAGAKLPPAFPQWPCSAWTTGGPTAKVAPAPASIAVDATRPSVPSTLPRSFAYTATLMIASAVAEASERSVR